MKFVLIQGAAAIQTIAAVPSLDGSVQGAATNFPVAPPGPDQVSHMLPQSVGFQVTVTGDAGATVSATVQPVATIDGIHWAAYGNTITSGSGTTTATGIGAVSNSPYVGFGAYVTAISGSGAKATCLMAA